ncbi:20091_t:CDS:2 [Funneliformis geosporum]|nr:20091_t:CDS:2 [Funneliformis geosporum]
MDLHIKNTYEQVLEHAETVDEKIKDKDGFLIGDPVPRGRDLMKKGEKKFLEEYKTELCFDKEENGQTYIFQKKRYGENGIYYKKFKNYVKIAGGIGKKELLNILGSGTTGHAILDFNRDEIGNRTFILCTNNEGKICEDVTYERIKRVINGYTDLDKNKINGLGGNLKYLETDFIKLEKSSIDSLKDKMVQGSTEILCLKENTFELVLDNYEKNRIKVFQNSTKYSAILFDLFYFEAFVEQLRDLKDKPVSVYVFSYAKEFSKEEFEGLDIKFTQKAVDNLYQKAEEFLKNFSGLKFKKILFRAPTGSGKTVMMSNVIERLALERVLAEQSKDSIEEKIGGGGITTSFLEDILDNCIKKNEILFINWEEIFSKAGKDNPDKDIKKGDPINRFMRDNEDNRFLSKFCEKTIEEGRKIVLIIDESHLNITPNTIQIIEEIIKPSLQIDMTATPKNRGGYSYGDRDEEYIELQDVKDAQMIKKEVIINPEIDFNDLKSEKGGDQIVLEKALQKREELEELYRKEGSKISPLVLIQLPNEEKKLSELDKQKRD